MTMSKKRGSRPKKTDDRLCGRRIRKSTRQAGSPDPLDVCPIHTASVVAEVARLSYQLRKRRVPDHAFATMVALHRRLSRLVRRLVPKPVRVVVTHTIVVESGVPKKTVGKKSSPFSRLGVGHPDRRPIEFVRACSPYTPESTFVRPPPRRAPGFNILRRGWIRDLALDERVAGTFLEAPLAKKIRDVQAKGYTWKGLHVLRPHRLTRGSEVIAGEDPELVPDTQDVDLVAKSPALQRVGEKPGVVAAVGSFDLASAIGQMRDDDFVSKVKAQAPPDLAALLAGEDWGVMKF